MIIRDLPIANHEVVGENAANGFVETAADGFVRHLERREGRGASGMHFLHRLFEEVERATGSVSLEVSAGAVAFDSVGPLRDLPFEFRFRFRRRFGQPDFHAMASGLDVTDIDQVRQRRRPETGERPAAGVESKMISSAFIQPARRHHPGIIPGKVALLRFRNRALVPRMTDVDRIAERIVFHKRIASPLSAQSS